MREIKFRGKRVDNNEWVVGSYIYGHGFGNPDYYIDIYGSMGAFTGFERHEVIPETVGQYTGLKDINGVEIYEGSKIRYVHEDDVYYDEEDNIVTTDWIESEVYWGGYYPAFDVRGHDEEYNLLSNDEYRIQVIGNIHDTIPDTSADTTDD